MGKTIEDVKRERETAGAAYQAAASAYLDAWVELAALDLVLSNAVYGDPAMHANRFREEPTVLSHGDFPTAQWSPSLGRRAQARHEEILSEMSTAEEGA